jgi:serine/threonine protein kinase
MDMEDLVKGEEGSGLDWKPIIRFSGGHVVKECIVDTYVLIQKQHRVERVISVLQHGLEGVQHIVGHKKSSQKRQRSGKFYLATVLGETISRVESPEQLRSLIECLLQTVRRLHNVGITHRDIRLPNIVRSFTDGKFALIDWDESVMGIQNLDNAEVAHLNMSSHAPEIYVAGGQHDSKVDLWSIGHLIHCSQEHADKQLLKLMDRLLAPADERPSDDEACHFLGIE